MQSHIPRTAKVVLAATLACGVAASPALADTIPFTSAFTGTITPAAIGQAVVSERQPQEGATPPGHATAGQSPGGEWGSATASASADMASGQLGGQAGVNFADGSIVFSQFQASIGDGFRSFDDNNAPFAWDGETASFTLDVHGDIFAPANLQNVSAYVSLILYAPGSVQPDMNYFGDAGKIDHYLYFLGNPNQRAFYTPEGAEQPIELFPTAYLDDLSSGVHIDQEITPGGDFDWVLLMHGSSYLTGPGSLDVDLSHTVTFGYTGPTGATTRSVSGAFNNITNQQASVPEPATFVLLGWGVCAVAARRRLTGA